MRDYLESYKIEKNEFSLIDTSFLKLPQDIKISYAMDNFSKVITTGEYVDIKNKKNHLMQKVFTQI